MEPLDGWSTVNAAGSGEPVCDVGWLPGSDGKASGKPGEAPSTTAPKPTTPLYGELVSATMQ